jgi:hypothetical protein
MRKEMLPGKLSANPTVSAESSIVVEEKKKRGEGGRLLLFLMAVGIGAVALTSITALAPVSFYGYVASPGSINDDSGNMGDGAAAIPTAVAASSATATDGKGTMIEDNGVTESAKMTISGYSDSKYDAGLRCWIDSLPLYCSGNPVTVSGLPPGEHTFTIVEPSSGETIVRAFSWTIS